MYFRIEQEVPQGGKPSITKEDVVYDALGYEDDEPTYPDPLSADELGEVRSAATSAAASITGRRLLTVEGHRGEGDGPQPEQLIVTVSRILSE